MASDSNPYQRWSEDETKLLLQAMMDIYERGTLYGYRRWQRITRRFLELNGRADATVKDADQERCRMRWKKVRQQFQKQQEKPNPDGLMFEEEIRFLLREEEKNTRESEGRFDGDPSEEAAESAPPPKRAKEEVQEVQELLRMSAELLAVQREVLAERRMMRRLLDRAVAAVEKMANDDVDDRLEAALQGRTR